MEELFDDLFAYRLHLQDIYSSETIIIKKLKMQLLNLSYREEDINDILYNFYLHFNIEITIEQIRDVNTNIRNGIHDIMILNNYNNNFNNLFLTLINNLRNVQSEEQEDIKITLDEDEYNKLEKIKIEETTEENCSICIEKIEKGNEVIKLPCGHLFHDNCIKSYLLNYDYKCPLCRHDIGKHKIHLDTTNENENENENGNEIINGIINGNISYFNYSYINMNEMNDN
jgi:hypothetical protein